MVGIQVMIHKCKYFLKCADLVANYTVEMSHDSVISGLMNWTFDSTCGGCTNKADLWMDAITVRKIHIFTNCDRCDLCRPTLQLVTTSLSM